ncbi:MAG: glycosyltransferase family 87 protein [Tepidisphaeraceae bacterium]
MEGQAQQPVEPETAMASRLYVCVRLVALLLLLAAVVQSFLDASHYYGADLRARVVGARAMLRGLDPYFLPMRADQPETLQDPFRYALQFSRCTYAPTLLWLYAPFANLVFTTQRWIWWCLEWTALLSSIYLLGQVMASSVVRNAYFLLAAVFFACGPSWRLDLERGQYYVFVLLGTSATVRLCLGRKGAEVNARRDHWWNGLPLGLAISIRLTPVVMVPALWLAGYRKTAHGAAGFALVLIASTFSFRGARLWQSYFRNASLQNRFVTDAAFAAAAKQNLPAVPQTIEGIRQFNLLRWPAGNVTFASEVMPRIAARVHFLSDPANWNLYSMAVAGLICAAFTIAMIWSNVLPARDALGCALLIGVLIDFFLPVRWSYADVTLLAPFAVLFPGMLGGGVLRLLTGVIAVAALALAHTVGPLMVEPRILMVCPIGLTAAMAMYASLVLYQAVAKRYTYQAANEMATR